MDESSFTEEQREILNAKRREWLAVGLCTEPSDRDNAEAGAVLAYELQKLARPRVQVWTPSPGAGAVAAAIVTHLAAGARAAIEPATPQPTFHDKVSTYGRTILDGGDRQRARSALDAYRLAETLIAGLVPPAADPDAAPARIDPALLRPATTEYIKAAVATAFARLVELNPDAVDDIDSRDAAQDKGIRAQPWAHNVDVNDPWIQAVVVAAQRTLTRPKTGRAPDQPQMAGEGEIVPSEVWAAVQPQLRRELADVHRRSVAATVAALFLARQAATAT